ncbi:hypothetical protein [Mesorhizobium ciceri]|uniref:hypothetical protein n=1 Tax=Mesorhizobium ciceri TaxID=39645 RepID=UPI00047D5687|nr:hypothetical protein [Mesorhizobium ciceri]
MKSFKVEAMHGDKAISSALVEAQSHVHALVKSIRKPLKPGRTPGKPWIRVTDLANLKASEFQKVD